MQDPLLRGTTGSDDGGAALGLRASHICYDVLNERGEKRTILNDVSASFAPCSLTAVMGASGAGKTTLLNALSRSIVPTSGEVRVVFSGGGGGGDDVGGGGGGDGASAQCEWAVSGRAVSGSAAAELLARSSALVPQDELLLPVLTAREMMEDAWAFATYRQQRRSEGAAAAAAAAAATTTTPVPPPSPGALLHQFSLTPSADVVIGHASGGGRKGLSGGQRKRLSIAAELMFSPRVLFLDEPTSGLDSASAMEVCALLRELAHHGGSSGGGGGSGSGSGRCIVATIHQPSAALFELFDQLVLLGAGGVVVYAGPTAGCRPHFAALGHPCPPYHSVSDFMLELLSPSTVAGAAVVAKAEAASVAAGRGGAAGWRDAACAAAGYLAAEFAAAGARDLLAAPAPPVASTAAGGGAAVVTAAPASMAKLRPADDDASAAPASSSSPLRTLLRRAWRVSLRDPVLLKARFASHAAMGLIIGGMYWDMGTDLATTTPQRVSLALFFILFLALAVVLPTIIALLPERAVFLKERRNGWYAAWQYSLTKLAAELPLLLVPPVVFVGIVWCMTGLSRTAPLAAFARLVLALLVVTATSHSWAVAIASWAPTLAVGVFVLPLSLMPLLMLGGFFQNVSRIPWAFRWICYGDWLKYAWDAVAFAMFHDVTLTTDGVAVPGAGEQVLEVRLGLGTGTGLYWHALIAMAGFYCVTTAVGFLLLTRKIKHG